ncbi:Oxygen-independent coproporphyrinogen-III oxidase 1 [Photobacterium damselae subsp. piscicida]|uniref:HutW protein n=1 Tax=Photobacterium damsela subsp. piscicida TaxID=38294 RepID=L7NJX8_PHODP|nr:HutW protein [Photobacterium damselae subsp. piscicida]BAX53126.1 Oxygen-independent coproporphyrinogen-III oxidase 1 [Photobacterium damselae subsp. piscicida]GAW45600.1 Oxygen-independent coproporphyrinogen-III oxidase 1 [Photobacterium damselae subsp. piscicida]
MNQEHQIDINKLDESILGLHSPDSLRFAFSRKKSAHAGGMNAVVPAEQQQSLGLSLLGEEKKGSLEPYSQVKKRCLYVHIPFCRVRCTYCNFFQYASSQQLIDDYFAALMIELKLKAQQPWTQSAPFHAVYIGGGTPTELTLEGRINRFSDEMFYSALEGGFNRFSFGVQSFDTQVRRKAKRLDDREVVLDRVAALAATDQAPIVIDLPYQTLDVWQQDLEDFMASGAHGVDLYQLIEMGGTPMKNLIDKGKLPEPADTQTKATMFLMGHDYMSHHHMRKLSVNHWARDNRERSLYNSLAKTTAEVLPLGAGAGGNIAGFGMMQHRTLDAYLAAIKRGELPIAMMTKQANQASLHAEIKASFDRGVLSRSSLDSIGGKGLYSSCLPLFKAWRENGLVEVN